MNLVPNAAVPQAVQHWLDRVGGGRNALVLAVGIGAAVLIFAFSRWATAPDWVPLHTGLPLDVVGRVTERLTDAGIKHRLEMGGTEVRVAAPDLARARVLLAGEGLPAGGRPGLELFDQPSWGMTDFTQRINYRRALEGELERTIGRMRGVEGAQVHLAMQEGSSFRRADRPSEASVVLKLRSGAPASAEVVQGVAHLVASSVDGLTSDRVTVLDDSGRLLSAPNEGSAAGLTNRQLAVQREVEAHLGQKAEQLVSRIVGPGNARIQVAATLSFDRVERTVQTVDPERQALASEQRAEIIPGAEGGAGSSNQSATYENSRSLETFSGAAGALKRLSVAVLVNDREVARGESVTYEPRSPAELARIEALVRSAVGLDDARGDMISVVSIPFTAMDEPPSAAGGMDVWSILATVQRPALTLLGLLLAFGVALAAIRSLRGGAGGPAAAAALASGGAAAPAPVAAAAAAASVPAAPMPPVLPANSMMRGSVVESVTEYPDLSARLVRAWLKES